MSSAGMNWFNKEGALDSLDAMAKEKLDLTMQAYGGKAVSEVTTKNEKGQRVSSGIYYYRLTVSGRDTSRRMVVLR